MKILKFLIYTLILLIIVGCGSSREDEEFGGEVPYIPCPCNEQPEAKIQFSKGEAYLFNDSISEQLHYEIQRSCWIVFDSITNVAILTITSSGITNICKICNFPNFAKSWDIPLNGCKVYFEGVNYSPCVPKGSLGVVSHYDYILTNLKRK